MNISNIVQKNAVRLPADMSKKTFKENYIKVIEAINDKPAKSCSDAERLEALVFTLNRVAARIRTSKPSFCKELGSKKVYYFSMEFLIGKLTANYLVNLEMYDMVEEALGELGINLETLLDKEPDPGLGNGGLGRLAACFLDSMAAVGINGTGHGLRYHFGLFKQQIKNGYQNEVPDAWLDDGYVWENARPQDSIVVRFGGNIEREFINGKLHFKHVDYDRIKAVPYNVPIFGFGGKLINHLHLWEAREYHSQIDMDAFNNGCYMEALKEQTHVAALTSILYPDDSTLAGKTLRLKQEYFLVAAGVGLIVKNYILRYGKEALPDMHKYLSIHINDTHPAMCVPELMRLLMDEHGMEWDDAWELTKKTISFTNHTVLPEALEKWDIDTFQNLLPRVYMIIEEINRRWQESLDQNRADWHEINQETSVLWNGEVRMANLSIIGSHSVNGVSALHSDILVKDVFKQFYKLDSTKFNNKTNGISHRRFLIQSNPELSRLITKSIGSGWKKDFTKIKNLNKFKNDASFLEELNATKRANKVRMSNYIAQNFHIKVDPDSIFDVQVKRMHAYKRQLLNALKILDLYNRMKANPNLDIGNYTFIFAGKAAASYAFAKESIKFINSLADIINADPDVNKKIKVVFIENFCVSNAQIIYPSAEISEQISTAGKEASGTGNMKFMMNGAVTLGTMDGANVEINELAGADNIQIFGLSSEEVLSYYLNGGYSSIDTNNANPRLKKMTSQLVDGFFSKCGTDFWGIYDELLQRNDEYFVLADFASYVNAWETLDKRYRDRTSWAKMSLANIANSDFFSSDRTILEYANDIWKNA